MRERERELDHTDGAYRITGVLLGTYKLNAVESISVTTTTTDFLYLVLIYCCYLLSSSVESLQTRELGQPITEKERKKKQKKDRIDYKRQTTHTQGIHIRTEKAR